jgi:recombinational DNA repair protein (RecF pathway)
MIIGDHRFYKMAYDEQMATYSVHAVNLSTYSLGETDKIVTMFSAERGLIRAVAKGARKPGAKIGGRFEPLNINQYLKIGDDVFRLKA